MGRYANHFLTNVIVRLDFVSEESQIKMELASNVNEICIKHFPIAEKRKTEIQEVQLTNGPDGQFQIINQQSAFEWHYWGKNREKELCITASEIYIDHKAYISYSDLKLQLYEIISQLQISYPNIKFKRVGLRYIDQISLVGDKIPNKKWASYWLKYLNKSLVQGLTFADDDLSIARQMNTIDMNYGDYFLRFQYGMYNEDYPAPNKKPVFILDTDAYSVGLLTVDELNAKLDVFHERAKDWFERAIKDDLRVKMGTAT